MGTCQIHMDIFNLCCHEDLTSHHMYLQQGKPEEKRKSSLCLEYTLFDHLPTDFIWLDVHGIIYHMSPTKLCSFLFLFLKSLLLIHDLQSADWINTYYMLKGFLKARRPLKASNEMKCTNENMTRNTQDTNLSWYVPKAFLCTVSIIIAFLCIHHNCPNLKHLHLKEFFSSSFSNILYTFSVIKTKKLITFLATW